MTSPGPDSGGPAAAGPAADRSVAARTEAALVAAGAILSDDHFVYVSGDHGAGWVDKDAVFPDTAVVDRLCGWLADVLAPMAPDVLCGPAVGGLVTAQWTARHLGCLSVFAEHRAASAAPAAGPGPVRPPFELRRGYDRLVAGKRVVVVDDIVNTGLSTRQTVAAVQAAGGTVVGAGALATRGNAGPADLGADDFAFLLEVRIPSWPAADCHLCRAGVPVNTRYAHGADFVATHGWPG
ncbi:MAG TPA: phosphoribosyltransferase family protein [Acidimicrobiales bacterium]|nr:phosphoribosyltransferase family protein [Acidimicrobiales bacterium]